MRTQRMRVMLLVDADNVSPDVMEQAMEAVLHDHGAAHIRRAYCTPESAVKNAALFKRLSLRPMVNLSTGKNATDIALAIDALDLAIAERPEVAVIVSSDSDFAPLVLRLREKGCRVEGIGQQGKTGEASKAVYDAFLDLVHRKAGSASPTGSRAGRSRAAATPLEADADAALEGIDLLLDLPQARRPSARSASRTTAPPVTRPVTRSAAAGASSEAASPATAARKTAPRRRSTAGVAQEADPAGDTRPAAPVPAPAPAVASAPASRRRSATAVAAATLPEAVQAILKAVPPLAAGQPVALGIAAERLRAAGLLARNAASTRLFARHARHFLLAPAGQPNTVQFVAD